MIRRKYHQSEIKTFLMCGMKWKFLYVDKLRRPRRAAASIGSSADAAISANLAQKVKSGVDLPLGEVLEICSKDFNERAKDTIWDEEDTAGPAKDSVIACVKLHHEIIAPKIIPATVQEEFVIETDAGFDLAGTIDLTETSGVIVDTKTSSRQRASSHVIERAFQPAMYDFAFRAIKAKLSAGFRFDVITRPTVRLPAEYKPVIGQVTEADHEWLFNAIGETDKAIKAGVALPAPEGSWFCSEKWCEFWSICKGKK